ncbi:MAG: DUF4058 family protein [Zavarzinella sp.]
MPSPFPGMDPFLEQESCWPAFQHQFISALYQTLLPLLVDHYRLEISVRQYITEEPLFTSIIRQNHAEEYLEIRHKNNDTLVTTIDLVSPTNRLQAQGRAAYHATRQQSKALRANLVELDLVLQGKPLRNYIRELPEHDYLLSVSRSNNSTKNYEIYPCMLEHHLPRVRCPLIADERDCILDVQKVFRRAFELGNFDITLDYEKNLTTMVPQDKRDKIEHMIRTSRRTD